MNRQVLYYYVNIYYNTPRIGDFFRLHKDAVTVLETLHLKFTSFPQPVPKCEICCVYLNCSRRLLIRLNKILDHLFSNYKCDVKALK